MSLPAVITPGTLPAFTQVSDDELLREFLESFSERTRRAYGGDLRDFAFHLGASSPAHAVAALLAFGPGLANLQVLHYRTAMQGRNLSSATIGRRMAALKSVVRLARTFGRVNWQLEIKAPTVEPYRDTAGPGLEGWRKLLKAAGERQDVKGLRDLAIMRLLHDLGGRRSEIATLDLEHVDQDEGQPTHVWILGKGKSKEGERVRLRLPKATADALRGWLRVRGPHDGPLFCPLDQPGDFSRRLSGRSIARNAIAPIGVAAGLPRVLHPHALRHEAITTALDRTNGNVRAVQRFSRHKNVQTLIWYDDRRKDPGGDIADLVASD
jgi:integrase/recombinase XerC